jgi:hypothetical protein
MVHGVTLHKHMSTGTHLATTRAISMDLSRIATEEGSRSNQIIANGRNVFLQNKTGAIRSLQMVEMYFDKIKNSCCGQNRGDTMLRIGMAMCHIWVG